MVVVRIFISIIFLSNFSQSEAFSSEMKRNASQALLENKAIEFLCIPKLDILLVSQDSVSFDAVDSYLEKLRKCEITLQILRIANRSETYELDAEMSIQALILFDASTERPEDLSIDFIPKVLLRKYRSNFLIAIENAPPIDYHSAVEPYGRWLRAIFEKFWQYSILQVVGIFYSNNGIQIYTFSPYHQDFLVPLELSGSFTFKELFFKNLINFYGKPLRIGLTAEDLRVQVQSNGELPTGPNVRLSQHFANRLQAVAVFHTFKGMGSIYENGSATELLAVLRDKSVDICMNTFTLREKKFALLERWEPTRVVGRDDICIMVPRAQQQLNPFNILKGFSWAVWTGLVSVITVFVIFMKTVTPQPNKISFLLVCWLFGNNMPEFPKTSKLRLCISGWLLFSFCVTLFYKSNLTTNLVLPQSGAEMDKFEVLMNSGIPLITTDERYQYVIANRGLLSTYTHPVSRKIFYEHLDKKDNTFAYLERDYAINFRIRNAKDASGSPLFHRMQFCPIPFYTVFLVPMGSPLLGYFNRMITDAYKFGIFDAILEHYQVARLLKREDTVPPHSNSVPPDSVIVLRLDHMIGTFYFLIAGLGFASIIFGGELLHFWHRKKYRNS